MGIIGSIPIQGSARIAPNIGARVGVVNHMTLVQLYRQALKSNAQPLIDALASADWGRQSDGSFVTISNTWEPSTWMTLNIHDCPVATIIIDRRGTRLHSIHNAQEARDLRNQEKSKQRAAQELYMQHRDQVIEHLQSGGTVTHFSGQKGGVFVLGDRRVSARGVLKQLGIPAESLSDLSDGCDCGLLTIAIGGTPMHSIYSPIAFDTAAQ